ncbi:MAG: orotidine-5'-phosphate decarboxylase [Bacteroidales bacterium]|nr:orotidine-5'-phosphate decarboxylase [Bacteroidales bacterium]
MDHKVLFENIKKKKSYLCVGLDSDIDKLPEHLKNAERPVLEFNKQIIDATAAFTVAYKPNLAFYESRGLEGWEDLELTARYIKEKYPDIFLIADAKRGDIGNTSKMYAKAFFEKMNFDAVTVAPYMGEDSVSPFLSFDGKYIIILALTSNPGASDFQYFTSKEGKPLFTEVIEKSKGWGTPDNIMYVVGATKASMLVNIRESAPDHFLLVPGIGAQGGSLEEVAKYGMNKQCGLLVNASRSIIFASKGVDFADQAAAESNMLQEQMEVTLKDAALI